MKVRVACCSLLYRKMLKVPINLTNSQTSVGQVNFNLYFKIKTFEFTFN